jgi:hypothetical protein
VAEFYFFRFTAPVLSRPFWFSLLVAAMCILLLSLCKIHQLSSPNLGDYQIVKSTQRDRKSGALNAASSLVGK